MSIDLQISWPAVQPLLLSRPYSQSWFPRKEWRFLSHSSFSFCSAPYRPVFLWARSAMDRHVNIQMGHPAHPPFPYFSTQGLQHFLNVSSRWIVCAVAVVVLVLRHDDQVLWAFLGSIINTVISKLLKKMFNQQRPLTALGLKADPGMPSSHAQSFGFLGLYAAIGVIFWKGLNIVGVASAFAIVLCSSYLAWLRFTQGLHTRSQVIVGAGCGACIASSWIALWHYLVRKMVTSSIVYHHLLIFLFGSSTVCFLALGVRKWRLGAA